MYFYLRRHAGKIPIECALTYLLYCLFLLLFPFSSEDYPEIQRLFPYADIQYIPDASHWIHADKPLEFISSIITFVQS